MTTPLWHCPEPYDPDRRSRPGGPWCDAVPCVGHRASKVLLEASDVVAWTWGHGGLSDTPAQYRQHLVDTAALCLADLGRL